VQGAGGHRTCHFMNKQYTVVHKPNTGKPARPREQPALALPQAPKLFRQCHYHRIICDSNTLA
jgi:hypothetical protein